MLAEEEITIGQAAALMDLNERHARRLLAAYRERGAEALAHGNRGRRPHNTAPEAVAAAVVPPRDDVDANVAAADALAGRAYQDQTPSEAAIAALTQQRPRQGTESQRNSLPDGSTLGAHP